MMPAGSRSVSPNTDAGLVGLSAWVPRGLAARIEEHNSDVRGTLLDRLRGGSPKAFEDLVGEVLVALGFEEVTVTALGGDGGVDVRGTLVVGEVVRIRMAVQAKRWKGNVGAPVVQQVPREPRCARAGA